jgi:hypothetical protein
VRIHHHHRAGLRVVQLDRFRQFPFGNELNALSTSA